MRVPNIQATNCTDPNNINIHPLSTLIYPDMHKQPPHLKTIRGNETDWMIG